MDEERLTLNKKELKRLKVLKLVKSGALNVLKGAESLGISERHMRRLKAQYVKDGEEGLIHGNRGRKPKHALTEEIKERVLQLYVGKYSDSNFTHYSELLAEREGITLSESSVGRILRSSGCRSKHGRRRSPKKHRRRERRSQSGMLWQTDATPHEWLGKEAGRFTLHAAIDDATGIVVGAVFTRNECAEGYALVMREGIGRYGIPLGLYSDKHTIFRSPNEKLSVDQELDGERIPLSNFGKAMVELNIEHIKANTAQAKGRIERLWGTLQDRLPVELRLLGVKSIDEANRALPGLIARHNERYAVAPADTCSAYTPLDAAVNLEHVFAVRSTRKIDSGSSISYNGALYVPVSDGDAKFNSKVTVEVRETYSGEVFIWHKGRAVALKKIEKGVRSVRAKHQEKSAAKTPFKPAEDHPWRTSGREKIPKEHFNNGHFLERINDKKTDIFTDG
jgi:transposase